MGINRGIDFLQRHRFVLYFFGVIGSFVAFFLDKYIVKLNILTVVDAFLVSILFTIFSVSYEIATKIEDIQDELKHPDVIKCPGELEKIKCPIKIKTSAVLREEDIYAKLKQLAESLSEGDKVHVTDRNYEEGLEGYYNILRDRIKNERIELSRYTFLSRDEKDEKSHADRLDKLDAWLKEEHKFREAEKVIDKYRIYCTILPYFYNCICVYSSDANKDSKVMIGMNDAILPHGFSRGALYIEGSHDDLDIFTSQFDTYRDAQKQNATKIYYGENIKDIYKELKEKMGP